MYKKKAGFFMIITGSILAIVMTIFIFYFIIIKRQSIGDNGFLLYTLYLVPTILIVLGYGILNEAEKNDNDNK